VPEHIERGEIIRALVGSTLHGTGLPGREDTDYMGVCIEPWEAVVGLERFDQWQWRSQPEGVRSGPGDIDITIYGLRKYLHLAVKGNPSILLLLFVPPEHLVVQTEWGERLQALAPAIVSKRVAGPFLGYATAQRDRLLGLRGGKHTNRPELIEEFGYDTKYAMHALRLAFQGQEILSTGRITLPVPAGQGSFLRAVRRGEVSFDEVVRTLDSEIDGIRNAESRSNLPDAPDMERVNGFIFQCLMSHWIGGDQ
jgi:predicted nucleotidyltransferase